MPQIREQIAMVHLPPSKTLKYLFHVRKTKLSCWSNGKTMLCNSMNTGSIPVQDPTMVNFFKEATLNC